MSWSSLVNAVDIAAIDVLGGVSATFIPQDNSGSQNISGIIRNPAMDEDFTPGSSQGTSVVRFFVRFANITPQPRKGDVVVINGISYMIVDASADTEGGAVLVLKKT